MANLLTVKETAELCGLGEWTLRNYRHIAVHGCPAKGPTSVKRGRRVFDERSGEEVWIRRKADRLLSADEAALDAALNN